MKISETAMTYDEFIASEEKPEKKKKGNSKRKRSPSPPPKVRKSRPRNNERFITNQITIKNFETT